MPRRQPIRLPEHTYSIARGRYLPHSVFSHPDGYALIRGLLPPALKRTVTHLLGCWWKPNIIRLALQIDVTTPSSSEPGQVLQVLEWMSTDNSTTHSGARSLLERRHKPDMRSPRND